MALNLVAGARAVSLKLAAKSPPFLNISSSVRVNHNGSNPKIHGKWRFHIHN